MSASEISAGVSDTFSPPWLPVALVTLLSLFAGHSLWSVLMAIMRRPGLNRSTEVTASVIVYLELALLGIVFFLSTAKRFSAGPVGAQMTPARDVDVPTSNALSSLKLWSLTATVAVVAGGCSEVFIHDDGIAVDWWKNTNTNNTTDWTEVEGTATYAPAIYSGILLGVVFTMCLYEAMARMGMAGTAGGVATCLNSWVLATAFLVLMLMDDMTQSGDNDEHAEMKLESASEKEFVFALFLLGFAMGGVTTLVPTLIDEWFGLSAFGTLIGIVWLGAIAGQILLADFHFQTNCSRDERECFLPIMKVSTVLAILVGPMVLIAGTCDGGNAPVEDLTEKEVLTTDEKKDAINQLEQNSATDLKVDEEEPDEEEPEPEPVEEDMEDEEEQM